MADSYFTDSRRSSALDLKSASDVEKNNSELAGQRTEHVVGVGGVGLTQRRLQARHVTFIGFGSGIGTGLFIGTGSALASAGPLGLLLAYLITGFILWCVMQCIGELAALIPTAGTFPHYANRFVGPSVGFSLAISYYYCYAISVASELSAAAVLVGFWSDITPALTITVGFAAMVALNFCGVRWFGESEVVFSAIKILLFVTLIIVGLVIDLGGAPNNDRLGFRYWKEGVFQEYPGVGGGALSRFLAFFSAFINAAYTFIGIECVAIAAAESTNPSRHVPKAIRRVVWRILFFYIFGVLIVGMIVSANNPLLTSDTGDANSSPFVIAIRDAGIPVLPSFINACILTSAWSAGNAYLWTASRTLVGMSIDRQAPQIFSRVNRWGVPYYSVGFTSLFGFLAYLSLGSGGASAAFSWLLNLSTIAGLVAWGTLAFAYVRFHKACKVQNIDRSAFPLRSFGQPYTAWFAVVACVIIILFSGFGSLIEWNAQDFVAAYVGIPIFVVPIVGWLIWKRDGFRRARDMDLWSGRLNPEDEVEKPAPTTAWGRFIDWLL